MKPFKHQVINVLAVAALVVGIGTSAAQAQDYPNQPVRIVVPSSPGGGLDLLARALGVKLTDKWGQQIIVENQSGAGGTIGTAAVAQAAPDGYTLLFVTTGFVTNPTLMSSLSYDPLNDFTPITVAGYAPLVLVANPSAPFNDVESFVNHARENPEEVFYGSAGIGSGGHLSMELLQQIVDIKLSHIPYQGAGALLTGTLTGEVPVQFGGVPSVKQYVDEGTLVPIAINSRHRSAQLPDVPTFEESGYSEFVVDAWFGVFGPAGLAPEVTQEIYDTLNEIISDPASREQIQALGFEVDSSLMTPDAFSELVRNDLELWRDTIARAGIEGVQ